MVLGGHTRRVSRALLGPGRTGPSEDRKEAGRFSRTPGCGWTQQTDGESASDHLTLSPHPLPCGFAASLIKRGFPGGSDGKAPAYNAGDLGSIPGLGRSPGEGNGNLLQYLCLENLMDRGDWWAAVHGVTKSRTRLSNFHPPTPSHQKGGLFPLP